MPTFSLPRQKTARVSIFSQVRDEVKCPSAPSAALLGQLPSGVRAVGVSHNFGRDEQMFGESSKTRTGGEATKKRNRPIEV
jgi:hypothetical protein